MGKSKKIQTTVDELAFFVAGTIAGTYSILGKELTGLQLNEVYYRLVNDISGLDLKIMRKEFLELLHIYELYDESEQADQKAYWDEIERILRKKGIRPPAAE